MPIQLPASLAGTGSDAPPASGHAGHGSAVAPAGQTFASALSRAAARQDNHGAHGATGPTAGALPSAGMRNGADGGTSHPRHLPLNGAHGEGHELQQKMLGLWAYRQQVIASNIANADTPGYRAVDVDMAETLGAAAKPSLPMTQSSYRHLAGSAMSADTAPRLIYHQPSQLSADGNTVEMDIERQKFAENALIFQFSLDRVGNHFKHLAELLQNLK